MNRPTLLSKILRRLAASAASSSQVFKGWHYDQDLKDVSLERAKYIHTHMTVAELRVLYDLAAGLEDSARVLELGSYLGASSCYLAAPLSQRNGRLYCVDTWENQTMPDGQRDTYAEFRQNTSAVDRFITPVRKRTDETVASDFNLPLDLVFVDADHSYSAVRGDYERVRDWVKDGGYLAFHDCTYFESVSRVLGEALASGMWQLAGNVDSLVWLRRIGNSYGFPNPMPKGD